VSAPTPCTLFLSPLKLPADKSLLGVGPVSSGFRPIYHDVADRDTTLGDGRRDHVHEHTLTKVDVHVSSGGDSDGIHDCLIPVFRLSELG